MSITTAFATGFVDTCLQKGLSVKAAAAMLWRFSMREASPDFLDGVKAACVNARIPSDIPELVIPKQAAVNRAFIKTARENIAQFDIDAALTHDPLLKQAFIRQRNALQLTLNAHILGEL